MTTAATRQRQRDLMEATRPARIGAVTRDLIADLDYYEKEKSE